MARNIWLLKPGPYSQLKMNLIICIEFEFMIFVHEMSIIWEKNWSTFIFTSPTKWTIGCIQCYLDSYHAILSFYNWKEILRFWNLNYLRHFPESIVGHFFFQRMGRQNITYTLRGYHSSPSFSTVHSPNLAFYYLCCRLCVWKRSSVQLNILLKHDYLKWLNSQYNPLTYCKLSQVHFVQ